MSNEGKIAMYVFLALAGVVVLTGLKKLLNPGTTDFEGGELQDIKEKYNLDNVTLNEIQGRLIGQVTYDEIGFNAHWLDIRTFWNSVETLDDVYYVIDLFGIKSNPWWHPYSGEGSLYFWLATEGKELVPPLNELLKSKGINFQFIK